MYGRYHGVYDKVEEKLDGRPMGRLVFGFLISYGRKEDGVILFLFLSKFVWHLLGCAAISNVLA